jgi:hypothetical protein
MAQASCTEGKDENIKSFWMGDQIFTYDVETEDIRGFDFPKYWSYCGGRPDKLPESDAELSELYEKFRTGFLSFVGGNKFVFLRPLQHFDAFKKYWEELLADRDRGEYLEYLILDQLRYLCSSRWREDYDKHIEEYKKL